MTACQSDKFLLSHSEMGQLKGLDTGNSRASLSLKCIRAEREYLEDILSQIVSTYQDGPEGADKDSL